MAEVLLQYEFSTEKIILFIDGEEIRHSARLYMYLERPLNEWIQELPSLLVSYINQKNFKLTFTGPESLGQNVQAIIIAANQRGESAIDLQMVTTNVDTKFHVSLEELQQHMKNAPMLQFDLFRDPSRFVLKTIEDVAELERKVNDTFSESIHRLTVNKERKIAITKEIKSKEDCLKTYTQDNHRSFRKVKKYIRDQFKLGYEEIESLFLPLQEELRKKERYLMYEQYQEQYKVLEWIHQVEKMTMKNIEKITRSMQAYYLDRYVESRSKVLMDAALFESKVKGHFDNEVLKAHFTALFEQKGAFIETRTFDYCLPKSATFNMKTDQKSKKWREETESYSVVRSLDLIEEYIHLMIPIISFVVNHLLKSINNFVSDLMDYYEESQKFWKRHAEEIEEQMENKKDEKKRLEHDQVQLENELQWLMKTRELISKSQKTAER